MKGSRTFNKIIIDTVIIVIILGAGIYFVLNTRQVLNWFGLENKCETGIHGPVDQKIMTEITDAEAFIKVESWDTEAGRIYKVTHDPSECEFSPIVFGRTSIYYNAKGQRLHCENDDEKCTEAEMYISNQERDYYNLFCQAPNATSDE